MAYSEVQICNIALQRLGQTIQITAMDEGTPASQACDTIFDLARDVVLRDVWWPFATKRAVLVEDTGVTVPDAWAYAYTYPTDCHQARYIEDDLQKRRPDQLYPYSIEHHPSSDVKIIYTDVDSASLVYTKKITNAGMLSDTFVDALAWRVAAEIAQAITGKRELKGDCMQMYALTLATAISKDFNEVQEGTEADVEYVATRY